MQSTLLRAPPHLLPRASQQISGPHAEELCYDEYKKDTSQAGGLHGRWCGARAKLSLHAAQRLNTSNITQVASRNRNVLYTSGQRQIEGGLLVCVTLGADRQEARAQTCDLTMPFQERGNTALA